MNRPRFAPVVRGNGFDRTQQSEDLTHHGFNLWFAKLALLLGIEPTTLSIFLSVSRARAASNQSPATVDSQDCSRDESVAHQEQDGLGHLFRTANPPDRQGSSPCEDRLTLRTEGVPERG